MTYRLYGVKDDGGYHSWFENSYYALNDEFSHIGHIDETLYEQCYNCMVYQNCIVEFESEAEATMFVLRWS